METSGDNGIDFRHPELWDEPDYIRKEMARAMGHIYRHGMTTTSGGNMSVTDSLGNTWITPSGMTARSRLLLMGTRDFDAEEYVRLLRAELEETVP